MVPLASERSLIAPVVWPSKYERTAAADYHPDRLSESSTATAVSGLVTFFNVSYLSGIGRGCSTCLPKYACFRFVAWTGTRTECFACGFGLF